MTDDLIAMLEWRQRELSQLRAILPSETDVSFETICRGAMVLTYAHWEGFFNEALQSLIESIEQSRFALERSITGISALFFSREIDSFLNRKVNEDSVLGLLGDFAHHKERIRSGREANARALSTRSNLDWERVEFVFRSLGVSWPPLYAERIFIKHKLARIRHEISHGSSPRLNRVLALEHIAKTEVLLEEVVEFFSFVEEHVFSPLKIVD